MDSFCQVIIEFLLLSFSKNDAQILRFSEHLQTDFFFFIQNQQLTCCCSCKEISLVMGLVFPGYGPGLPWLWAWSSWHFADH